VGSISQQQKVIIYKRVREGGSEGGRERGFHCFLSLPELSIIPLILSFSLPFSSVVKLSFFLVIVVVV
jgi:hypothetical protein